MELRFSDRIGKTKTQTELLKEGLSEDLAITLWNLIQIYVIEDIDANYYSYDSPLSSRTSFFRKIWVDFFKWPLNSLPTYSNKNEVHYDLALKIVREWFLRDNEWYIQLNFVEYCFRTTNLACQELFNTYFQKEFSAYRFVDGFLVEINSQEEIVEIENALKTSDKYLPVKTHLKTALELLSDKKSPDYRNSIKESISAIESLCRIIIGKESATLGLALIEIEKKHQLPGSLKAAFNALYGYTSNEGGIRHGLTDNGTQVGIEEARFMLVTCSAFVNYLVCKQ